MPRVKDLLAESRQRLAGRDTAALDSELLLAEAVGRSRSHLLARLEEDVPDSPAQRFRQLISRRQHGVPVAYLLGHKEFYGREFTVTPEVLVPRPETEELLEHGLGEPATTFVDLGTGSGCLAVSLALARPAERVIATDVSEEALRAARMNADRHRASLDCRLGSLLEPLRDVPATGTVVLANLPYVSEALYAANPDLRHEPAGALRGGFDGFDVYRQLFAAFRQAAWYPDVLWVELASAQQAAAWEYRWNEATFYADLGQNIAFGRFS